MVNERDGMKPRLAEYFGIVGLPVKPEILVVENEDEDIRRKELLEPIVELAIINTHEAEQLPKGRGWQRVEFTPTGHTADLNHGSLHAPEMFLCFRRGRDREPITDIGILYDDKDSPLKGVEVVTRTPHGRSANINNSSSTRTFLTFRRAEPNASVDALAVVDVCVILKNKGESAPHTYMTVTKDLNRSLIGSNVFICYKKARVKERSLTYRPAMLQRYPETGFENEPDFWENVPLFCLPMGASLEAWPGKAKKSLPVFVTFVLTDSQARKLYGAAVSFYEAHEMASLKEEEINALQLNTELGRKHDLKVMHSKAICVLSKHALFDTFRSFLTFILDQVHSETTQLVSIERHIYHFLYEIPLPGLQHPRILVQLNEKDRICLALPEETQLSQGGASFLKLLRDLNEEVMMDLFVFTLLEQKILIHSLRSDLLTSSCEAVRCSIFPFRWGTNYIPLCPLVCSMITQCPGSLLMGIDSRYFELYSAGDDIFCVDMDTGTTLVPESKRHISWKLLPKKACKMLRSQLVQLKLEVARHYVERGQNRGGDLEESSADQEFSQQRREQQLDLRIREAFLRFQACLLKNYAQYLLPRNLAMTREEMDAMELMDTQAFLQRNRSNRQLYEMLLNTQHFEQFLRDRCFGSERDDELAFFDYCTDQVDENSCLPRLLDADSTAGADRTLYLMPPEPCSAETVPRNYEARFPAVLNFKVLGSCKKLSKENTDAISTCGFDQNLCMVDGEQALSREAAELLLVPQLAELSSISTQSHYKEKLARRSKAEVRLSVAFSEEAKRFPHHWPRHLLTSTYVLWFLALPAYLKAQSAAILEEGGSVVDIATEAALSLQRALTIMVELVRLDLAPSDEVPYRIFLHLCCVHNQPVLAVQLFNALRNSHVRHVGAKTYGLYNKALYECGTQWSLTKAQARWCRLRNLVHGAAQFKNAGRAHREKKMLFEKHLNVESTEPRLAEVMVQLTEDEGNVSLLIDYVASKSTPPLTDQLYKFSDRNWKTMKVSSRMRKFSESATSNAAAHRCNVHTTGKNLHPSVKVGSPLMQITSIVRNSLTGIELVNLKKDLYHSHAGILCTSTGRTRNASMNTDSNFGCTSCWFEPCRATMRENLQLSVDVQHRLAADESGATDEELLKRLIHDEASSESFQYSQGLVHTESTRILPPLLPSVSTTSAFVGRALPEFEMSQMEIPSRPTLAPAITPLERIRKSWREERSDIHVSYLRKPDGLTMSTNHVPQEVETFSSSSSSSFISDDAKLSSTGTILQRGTGFNSSFRKLKSVANTLGNRMSANLKKSLVPPRHLAILNGSSAHSTSTTVNSHADLKMTQSCSSLDAVSHKSLERSWLGSQSSINSRKSGEDLASEQSSTFSRSESAGVDSLENPLSSPPEEDLWRLVAAISASHRSTLSNAASSITTNNNNNHVNKNNSGCHSSTCNNEILPRLDVVLTTCSLCAFCQSLVYDEEIQAGWNAHESNLNTICPFCKCNMVPQLNVYLNEVHSSSDTEGLKNGDANADDIKKDCIRVQYLSPLVLRKELENVFADEGESVLSSGEFGSGHSVLFWNLVWAIGRLHLTHHLAHSIWQLHRRRSRPAVQLPDFAPNRVRLLFMWDNPNLVDELKLPTPLYLQWQHHEQNSSSPSSSSMAVVSTRQTMQQILSYVMTLNINAAVELVLNARRRHQASTATVSIHRNRRPSSSRTSPTTATPPTEQTSPAAKMMQSQLSVYREIVFLCCRALRRENINLDSFDKIYTDTVKETLSPKYRSQLQRNDFPLNNTATWCRRFFPPLEL